MGGGLDLALQLYREDGNFSCVDWKSVAVSAGVGAALGPAVGAAGRSAWFGREFYVGKNMRVALFGNRTGHRYGKYPHYHRRVLNPRTGQPFKGQGIKRHRPWEPKQNMTSLFGIASDEYLLPS